ncbi:MAG: M15 family metallopeptidase [Candidatus Paceibacteria bacterium]
MYKFSKIIFFVGVFGFCLIFFTPTPTSAAGLAQMAQCSGTDCGTCEIIRLANGLIMWLIGFVFILFALLLMRAGIKLVTSGGNPGALQSAKDSFINALIGLIIILAAWLIVDTIMRALIGDERSGALVWSEIECTAQVSPIDAVVDYIILDGRDLISERDIGGLDGTPADDDSGLRGEGYTLVLRQGGSVEVTPCNSADLTTIPFMGHRITIHKNLVPSLRRVEQRWQSLGGQNYYQVRSVGGYSCRQSASGSGRYSNHAYGLALDINPAQNPYHQGRTAPPVTDMNLQNPHFYTLFKNEGWGWGGDWRNSKDAMHFSKATGEGGNMVGDRI